jgi:hypothetical protein
MALALTDDDTLEHQAAQLEQPERERQMRMLIALVKTHAPWAVGQCVDAAEEEWQLWATAASAHWAGDAGDGLCRRSGKAAGATRPPKPARATTVAIVRHLLVIALSATAGPVARAYTAGLVLCCVAALRVRDAQRASV